MTIRFVRTLSFLGLAASIAFAPAPPVAARQPRTTDGDPDLQGISTNATLTHQQRPAELGSKPYFTEKEAADYVKLRVEQQRNADRPEVRKKGNPGSYVQAFFDSGERIVKTRRALLMIDPLDERTPPDTADARQGPDGYICVATKKATEGTTPDGRKDLPDPANGTTFRIEPVPGATP